MEHLDTPALFKIRKALRYVRLYGVRRTLVKVRGQYHMKRSYTTLPPNHRPAAAEAHVGLIGCGNYAYSVIAYYLQKNHGRVIRGCMDRDINRAASLCQDYRAAYYSSDAAEVINDPAVSLVYIASNHASHAEYAIQALAAGKDVHIEKPHVVSRDQLERLHAAQAASKGRIVSIGYNRPLSPISKRVRDLLWAEDGVLVQNWFVTGHHIAPGHWYHDDGEGGRVLGNLCHWIDSTWCMVPPERRYPIRITPVESAGNMAVTYLFGDGSLATINFVSPSEYAFEGVREHYAAHRGQVMVTIDDFAEMRAQVGPNREHLRLRGRDHGHEASVCRSYALAADRSADGLSADYVWQLAELFLATREAVEKNASMTCQVTPAVTRT